MSTEMSTKATTLTRKDFLSQMEPKWCMGCGSYSAFKALTTVLPTLGIPREKFAIISGIGCSSRFPYYVNTYGFHTIHGRAPTVAMGLKLANPDLSVWICTGDGDALSIGGNHFIHLMRRNPNIKVLLFNNRIYGLTKGQVSPTSLYGAKTKSSPFGSLDLPLRPLPLAIASGATFAARVTDVEGELMTEVISAAARHKGVAFIEIMVNCVIFNDGAFSSLTDKSLRQETTVKLHKGEPIVFGAERNKGVRLNQQLLKPEVMSLTGTGAAGSQGLGPIIHDPTDPNPSLAFMLASMEGPSMPTALGIFRQVNEPVYESKLPALRAQDHATALEDLLEGDNSWTEGSAN